MARHVRALATAVLLTVGTPGCHYWRYAGEDVAGLVARTSPGAIRVTKTDGKVVELRGPVLRNDSITGEGPVRDCAPDLSGVAPSPCPIRVVPLSLAPVGLAQVEVRYFSFAQSFMLAASLLVATLEFVSLVRF